MSAITTKTDNEVLLVGFTDSKILDSQRIEQVGRELQEVIPQAVNKKLLLNFRGVSFMSSAMITKLVHAEQRLQSSRSRTEILRSFTKRDGSFQDHKVE